MCYNICDYKLRAVEQQFYLSAVVHLVRLRPGVSFSLLQKQQRVCLYTKEHAHRLLAVSCTIDVVEAVSLGCCFTEGGDSMVAASCA